MALLSTTSLPAMTTTTMMTTMTATATTVMEVEMIKGVVVDLPIVVLVTLVMTTTNGRWVWCTPRY